MIYSKFSVPNLNTSPSSSSVSETACAAAHKNDAPRETENRPKTPSAQAEARAVTSRVTVVSRSAPAQTVILRPEDNRADQLAYHAAASPSVATEKLSAADTPVTACSAPAPHTQPDGFEVQNSGMSAASRHGPEIVTSEPAFSDRFSSQARPFRSMKRGLFPPFGAVTAVCTLCFISFLLGCSLTDSSLCRVMIAISSAAAGRIPDRISDTPLAEDTNTVYQKYMTKDKEAPLHDDTVRYLSGTVPEESQSAIFGDSAALKTDANALSVSEVPVQSASEGKIGADGEILYPVLAKDLSTSDVLSLSNETTYSPDVQALLSETPAALQNLTVVPEQPLVLVLHTHGTECYNESPHEGFYDAALPVRSENTEENVVGIGEELTEVLNDFGIPTLHSTKLCDKDSFVRAYSTSAEEVRHYLAQYPSIRFVIDLHRDSIEASDGTKTKPVFSFAGQSTAQLMLVVGTDAAGANHPDWQNNLSLALTLQNDMMQTYPGLFRRINLRTASFNQQLCDGYLLLECGACANSHEEAVRAARLFATGFARVIKSFAS